MGIYFRSKLSTVSFSPLVLHALAAHSHLRPTRSHGQFTPLTNLHSRPTRTCSHCALAAIVHSRPTRTCSPFVLASHFHPTRTRGQNALAAHSHPRPTRSHCFVMHSLRSIRRKMSLFTIKSIISFLFQSMGDVWNACLGQLNELQQEALREAIAGQSQQTQ